MPKLSSKAILSVVAAALLIGASVFVYQSRGDYAIAGDAADSTAEFTEGVHYLTIDPAVDPELISSDAAADSGKIMVSEFFWYGCPHCQYFEPLVEEWQSTFPDDLLFEQVPVVWNDLTQFHAAIYYLGLGANDPVALHHKLFEEVIGLRSERNPSAQLQRLTEVLGDYGIDADKIKSELNSQQIREQVGRANQLMRGAQVSSTPTLMVDYRWVILNDAATGEAGIFNVANHLIELARQDNKQ